MKKSLLYILPFLLLSSLALAESELPECEGSPLIDWELSKTWTDCQGGVTFPDGTKYVGEFKDGQPHGKGFYTRPGGPTFNGIWKDGELMEMFPADRDASDINGKR